MPNPSWWKKTDELTTDRGGIGRNALGALEAVRNFRVIVSEPGVSQFLVAGAPGIPYLWSPYTSFEGGEVLTILPCIQITAKQEDHGEGEWACWIVTCNYSNDLGAVQPQEPGSNDPSSPNSSHNNPELEPPEVEWGGETMQRAFPTDLDSTPYVNSALKPFKPAVAVERGYRILTYTRNEMVHSHTQAEEYSYALNSDAFLGYPIGRVQCFPPTAKQVFKGRIYWRVTYKFRFFPELPQVRVRQIVNRQVVIGLDTIDWQPHVLDAGQMQLVAHPLIPGKFQVPIKRGTQNVSEDVPLDGLGMPQKPNADGTISPTFIKFRSYNKRPFAALMIRA